MENNDRINNIESIMDRVNKSLQYIRETSENNNIMIFCDQISNDVDRLKWKISELEKRAKLQNIKGALLDEVEIETVKTFLAADKMIHAVKYVRDCSKRRFEKPTDLVVCHAAVCAIRDNTI